jgi:hypothetical protein
MLKEGLGESVSFSVMLINFYQLRSHIVTEDRNLKDKLNVR